MSQSSSTVVRDQLSTLLSECPNSYFCKSKNLFCWTAVTWPLIPLPQSQVDQINTVPVYYEEGYDMSLVTKPVCNQVRLNIQPAQLQRLARVLKLWIYQVYVLYYLAGGSAPLLFAYGINRFSHDVAHIDLINLIILIVEIGQCYCVTCSFTFCHLQWLILSGKALSFWNLCWSGRKCLSHHCNTLS